MLPQPATRGKGVRLDYKVLSLATGGILAPASRTFAGLFPQVVSAMGLIFRNFYLESDVYEPTTKDLQV